MALLGNQNPGTLIGEFAAEGERLLQGKRKDAKTVCHTRTYSGARRGREGSSICRKKDNPFMGGYLRPGGPLLNILQFGMVPKRDIFLKERNWQRNGCRSRIKDHIAEKRRISPGCPGVRGRRPDMSSNLKVARPAHIGKPEYGT